MTRAAQRIECPGVEPVPLPEEATIIGGRAESWSVPCPRADDEPYEPFIVRGRE
ncbi:MAG TPA: hypothetical protein VGX25_05860 [Actinophytocola sp.]|uniref:hypothetical protein n=1 Tax=Actinophytocola sp. TaxID=1872138 RepID=UPI002DDC995E|nr:hypothetical protein [Actinophytocola sp.]HEV2778910.1 hypothetical protein [Actinophytocola sp.]